MCVCVGVAIKRIQLCGIIHGSYLLALVLEASEVLSKFGLSSRTLRLGQVQVTHGRSVAR